MENFKEVLIQFAYSNPNLFPNDTGNSYPMLIDQCFPQFFPDFQTPNHPPYAAMIYRAIWELNKKRGSSEKAISKFIKKEYADLPWAHSTLLKHHLQKLCDRNEIQITQKQCYLLAGAGLESGNKSSGPSKKRKKQTGRLSSDTSKTGSRPRRKYKKRMSNAQKTKVQVGLHKRKRKQKLKSLKKISKRVKKHAINEETRLVLLSEVNLKQDNDESGQEPHHDNSGYNFLEQSQTNKNPELLQLEVSPDSDLVSHGNGKRKKRLKSVKKSSKRAKKNLINEEMEIELSNEANFKQNSYESGQEQNEAGQESHLDNSGCTDLEQSQTNKNPELLQSEESPDFDPVLHENLKRVWTRSQSKTISKKDASDRPAIVEDLSNEEQQIATSPSSEKPVIELLKSISSELTRSPDDEPTTGSGSTKAKNPISSHQDQEPEKSVIEDEILCNSKSAAIPRKSQRSTKKGKVVNKKGQLKNKRNSGHTMTRRSSRNRSC